ncbi:hydantoinase B/oxoprolinase family protein [Conexibacter sp. CPCC 206217]|uniref:hydantoinase B/oxoprolinase family protein n=1 Tax=Conexibacter sp. CPCC 206217 TaxID=3064574 RepID=UPI00271DAE89|nr:hydantoinase B/oxoprolinase family protein [Conexibacter sp. CPCC 206217]MDO8212674.1 hydantoinase B/oxoprolinase family protein [Conexibacter sp. CPCC 206217]
MSATSRDPITTEVIRHGLAAASREMGVTLRKTSCSPIFNEGNDYSCGIFDARVELISHGEFLPIHLGSLPFSVRYAIDAFGLDGFEPGDAVLLNDPYRGGSHLPDVTIVSPIFADDELVGFAANRAHHLDVGGTVPGSFYSHATENYQEGLRITPVKLQHAGVVDEHLLELVLNNCRLPRQMRMDLQSQISANTTAIVRVRELVQRYGLETFDGAVDAILDASERRMRAAISSWPDGDYEASDYLDNDGISEERREIHVTVRIRGDAAEVDFTGSSPQSAGPVNSVLGYTHAGVYMTFQAASDPDISPNSGCYRPISIVAPQGTIVNPRFPAACTGGNEVTLIIHNTVFRALAKIPGGRPHVMACDQGSSNNLLIAGSDPRTGERYVLYEYPEGGWGGNRDRDGLSATFSIAGNTWNIPVEAVERRFPIRMECYELCEDSGGAGIHRGGLGVRRDYRVLDHTAELSLMGNRALVPPWGLDGGGEGGRADYLLDADTDAERPAAPKLRSKGTMIALEPGTVVTQVTAGGGGWGDPAQRPPARVAQDVRLGFVSVAAARSEYRVAVDERGLIDVDETARLRAGGEA